MASIVIGDDDRVGRWVCARTGGTWSPVDARAIGHERDGALVAGVVYDYYNGASVCMHVASDGGRLWLSRGFLRYVFSYPFDRMKVRKVIGPVSSGNAEALRFVRHIGFREEARVADATRDGDLVLFTMTRDTCRWLGKGA